MVGGQLKVKGVQASLQRKIKNVRSWQTVGKLTAGWLLFCFITQVARKLAVIDFTFV